MTFSPVIVSLPTADLEAAFSFYRDGLGLPLAQGGEEMPEPVVFALNPGMHLMLVPADGFGWVIGGHAVASPGTSECILSVAATTTDEVDAFVARAVEAGAGLVTAPGEQPWGYTGAFADPDGHVWLVALAQGAADG